MTRAPDASLLKAAEGHSIFAPSASHRWLACAGSLIPNVLAPDDAGYDAAYGTVAHGIAYEWLRTGVKPRASLGLIETVSTDIETFNIEVDQRMMAMVEDYVTHCMEAEGDHFFEVRVDFSDLTPIPDQGGTADHFCLRPHHLRLSDFKSGYIPVHAPWNPQVMLYAYGVFREWDWIYDFQEIEIHIVQPAVSEEPDTWTCTRKQLLDWAESVKLRAAAAWDLDALRDPSEEACRFCRVKETCPAVLGMLDDLVDAAFVDNELAENKPKPYGEFGGYDRVCMGSHAQGPEEMAETVSRQNGDMPALAHAPNLSTDILAMINQHRKLYEAWFKAIYEELEYRAQQGETVAGHKIVLGRKSRAWIDETIAEHFMQQKGVKKKQLRKSELISPAQAEELLLEYGYKPKEAEDVLAHLIHTSPGSETLVLNSDRRKAVAVAADEAFEDMTGGDL